MKKLASQRETQVVSVSTARGQCNHLAWDGVLVFISATIPVSRPEQIYTPHLFFTEEICRLLLWLAFSITVMQSKTDNAKKHALSTDTKLTKTAIFAKNVSKVILLKRKYMQFPLVKIGKRRVYIDLCSPVIHGI